MTKQEKLLYTFIPFEEFKSLSGVDDREDKITRFCLVTAAHTIEQYCRRRLLAKKHTEYPEFTGGDCLYLREYPVSKINAVFAIQMNNEQGTMNNERWVAPELYRVFPNCGCDMDFPFYIQLSPQLTYRNLFAGFRVVYRAGYEFGNVPADLVSACFELAVWNMNRYRGRRVGMTGNIRGSGKEGEHFEMSMPENVKALLEPYKRKVI
jgi:hypothetical protein